MKENIIFLLNLLFFSNIMDQKYAYGDHEVRFLTDMSWKS